MTNRLNPYVGPRAFENGEALYNSLNAEGKALARQVASQRCNGTNECRGLNACQTETNTRAHV